MRDNHNADHSRTLTALGTWSAGALAVVETVRAVQQFNRMDHRHARCMRDLPAARFAVTSHQIGIASLHGFEEGAPYFHRDGIFLGFEPIGAGDATALSRLL